MNTEIPFVGVDELVARINDGDTVAIPTMLGDFSGVSMVATRAIIQRGLKNLKLVCVPSSSLQADMLIGAGCVASIQAGAVLLYEYGPATRFIDAQRTGAIEVREATCPAIQAGLTAAEKGLPFMPVRGILGSDILRYREQQQDWRVIDNPFPPHDPIVAIPAIRPDVALFHAPLADRLGNLWVGRRGSFKLMAHAAQRTLATFERLYDGDFFDDPDKIPGVLANTYVSAVSHQPRGAWPLHFGKEYPEDTAHMRIYAEASRTKEGFLAYLQRHVYGLKETA
jgi:glutaconate CoA-transferase, subunit A